MNTTTVTHWHVERDSDDIVWLHFDKADASTNVLSAAVFDELEAHLDTLTAAPPRGVIFLSDKKSGFIAGADINEFTQIADGDQAMRMIRRGQAVFDRIAALPCPTLAMIHGYCLGGGLEMSLACRYRVADEDPSTRLGLPEVRLGIHPGFGGSVRSIALLGAPAAMDLMLSGRTLSARAAKKIGLIDHAVPTRQLRRTAQAMILEAPPARKPRGWQAYTSYGLARQLLAPILKRKVAARARQDHYPAPFALIELWREHGDDPARMLVEEARSVARLITGPTARNLIRVFQLQEMMKSLGRASQFRARHVHVVGAGVMGGDIAAWCALRGLHVSLQDQTPERIAPALQRAYKMYSEKLRLPRLVTAVMDRLQPDVDGRGVRQADVVIEAIFENVEAKRTLYRTLEPQMKPGALLATNTSSIPLQELATVLSDPSRLVGLHFFNPVAKMQLVEIVSSPDTSTGVAADAAAFTRQIDRLPLPVTSTPGFLVNRILMPYLLEAVTLADEGVPLAAIDQAALDFGMPMGPILLADTVGLDICLSVADILAGHFNVAVPQGLRDKVAAGDKGRKTGKGFYEFRHGKPVVPPAGDARPPADLKDRLMHRLFNEALACLRDGVVSDADLLDAGIIFGTGFAPFRGGPLHYLGEHFESHLARQRLLADRYGERFAPDPGWEQQMPGPDA